MNKAENFVDDMIKGILAAHPGELTTVAGDLRCMVNKNKTAGKVGIATGGGSGHLPLFLGYVGEGMLDGCSVGGVFQSPSSAQMLEVTKSINQGASASISLLKLDDELRDLLSKLAHTPFFEQKQL